MTPGKYRAADHHIDEETTFLGSLQQWLDAVDQELSVASQFQLFLNSDLARFPELGKGKTLQRWEALALLGEHDLALARLIEGHVDAEAILLEAGHQAPEVGTGYGVWAAGPLAQLRATPVADGWLLNGTKGWCSGSRLLTHALVTAIHDNEPVLLLVDLRQVGFTSVKGSWQAVGMSESMTEDTNFESVFVPSENTIGTADFYLRRQGFWLGAIGVACVWLGGARGVSRAVPDALKKPDAHRFAHYGAISSLLASVEALIAAGATAADAKQLAPVELEILARTIRAEVERTATEILDRTGRASGAGPLGHNANHARLVADLTVYLRQSHADVDLEILGQLVFEARTSP